MNEKKYFFKKLCNLDVEKAFLQKTNAFVCALYRDRTLVGMLQEVQSPFPLEQLLMQTDKIFPSAYADFPKFQQMNKCSVDYSNSTAANYYGLKKEGSQVYFDENFHFVTESNCFLSQHLWNIEPIVIYLKKSHSFVAGLYLHQHLVGCYLLPTCSVSLVQIAPYMPVFFPKDLNFLDDFAERNPTVAYFYSTDIIRIEANGDVLLPEENSL